MMTILGTVIKGFFHQCLPSFIMVIWRSSRPCNQHPIVVFKFVDSFIRVSIRLYHRVCAQNPSVKQILLTHGNPGHTIVVPLKPLPSLRDQLSQNIWDFCDRSRSQSKIIGSFRRHGGTAVLSTIKTLEKQKLFSPSNRGARKLYQAV